MKIIIYLLRVLLKIIAKLDNSIIYFSSFDGKYSDSPRTISEKIHEISKNIKIYWIIEDFNNKDIPNYVKRVKRNSFEDIKLQYKAKAIVDNVYGGKSCSLNTNSFVGRIKYEFNKWLYYKRGQKIYTTWHGTPLKKMGVDQVNSTVVDWSCRNTTMILGNNYTLEIMKRITFHKLKMKLIGIPRNDILFDGHINVNTLKKKLSLPSNKKIVLFAPSFRTDSDKKKNAERSGLNQINSINFENMLKLLGNKFGGEWVFVCRFHYHVENLIDWNRINRKYEGKVLNGNKGEDMAEYLKCSDILITDISSSIFDYSLTNKPAFIYFPDYEYYSTNERGLYMNINTLPFPVSTTVRELENNILNFNYDKYLKGLDKLNSILSYVNNDKTSSEKVANFILEDMYK